MKLLSISLIIFIIILGFSITFYYNLKDDSESILSCLNEMDSLVFQEKYEDANIIFIKTYYFWNTKEKFLKLQIEHNELDSINELFAELNACFSYNTYEDYYSISFKLKNYMTHLIDKNKLKLETIF